MEKGNRQKTITVDYNDYYLEDMTDNGKYTFQELSGTDQQKFTTKDLQKYAKEGRIAVGAIAYSVHKVTAMKIENLDTTTEVTEHIIKAAP